MSCQTKSYPSIFKIRGGDGGGGGNGFGHRIFYGVVSAGPGGPGPPDLYPYVVVRLQANDGIATPGTHAAELLAIIHAVPAGAIERIRFLDQEPARLLDPKKLVEVLHDDLETRVLMWQALPRNTLSVTLDHALPAEALARQTGKDQVDSGPCLKDAFWVLLRCVHGTLPVAIDNGHVFSEEVGNALGPVLFDPLHRSRLLVCRRQTLRAHLHRLMLHINFNKIVAIVDRIVLVMCW